MQYSHPVYGLKLDLLKRILSVSCFDNLDGRDWTDGGKGGINLVCAV